MKHLPPFVVSPASVPLWRFSTEVDAWGNGLKSSKARAFYEAKDAERFARRSGIGARICLSIEGFPVIASIVAPSAHHRGVVTEVTWSGGRYL